jgi:hypothetical protein
MPRCIVASGPRSRQVRWACRQLQHLTLQQGLLLRGGRFPLRRQASRAPQVLSQRQAPPPPHPRSV